MKFKKPWVKGGVIGAVICITLFFFYIFIYFPIIKILYAGHIAQYGGTPDWTLMIPTITGHFFVFMSSFFIPYDLLCKKTITYCDSWMGSPENCLSETMTATAFCGNMSEIIISLVLALLLIGIYFTIGAGIEKIVEKIKQRKG